MLSYICCNCGRKAYNCPLIQDSLCRSQILHSIAESYDQHLAVRKLIHIHSIVYNFRMVQTYDGDAKDEMKSYLEKAMDSMNTSFKSVVDSINEVVEDDCTVIVRYKNGDGEVLSEKEFK